MRYVFPDKIKFLERCLGLGLLILLYVKHTLASVASQVAEFTIFDYELNRDD